MNLSNSYALIDANDSTIDWDTICGNLYSWKISVGQLQPKFTDSPGEELTDEDKRGLLKYARILITDTTLEKADSVPVVSVQGKTLDEVMEEVDRVWNSQLS